jgi:hypothetical protein
MNLTKSFPILRILVAVALLLATGTAHGQQARRWQLSAACKPKLRIAFDAVRDLDPSASNAAFESAVAEAKKELRQARAVAVTRDDREAVEEIEVYRYQRDACHSYRDADGYRDCEQRAGATDWNISYGLGLAKKAPPKSAPTH